jgi:hypothetical protein
MSFLPDAAAAGRGHLLQRAATCALLEAVQCLQLHGLLLLMRTWRGSLSVARGGWPLLLPGWVRCGRGPGRGHSLALTEGARSAHHHAPVTAAVRAYKQTGAAHSFHLLHSTGAPRAWRGATGLSGAAASAPVMPPRLPAGS